MKVTRRNINLKGLFEEKIVERYVKDANSYHEYAATVDGKGWKVNNEEIYQDVTLTINPATGKEPVAKPQEFLLAFIQDVTRRVESQFSGLHGRCIWVGPEMDPRTMSAAKSGKGLKLTMRVKLPMDRMNDFVNELMRYESSNTMRRLTRKMGKSGNKKVI